MSNSKRWAQFVAWLEHMPEVTQHGALCYDKNGNEVINISSRKFIDTAITIKELKRLVEDWKK